MLNPPGAQPPGSQPTEPPVRGSSMVVPRLHGEEKEISLTCERLFYIACIVLSEDRRQKLLRPFHKVRRRNPSLDKAVIERKNVQHERARPIPVAA